MEGENTVLYPIFLDLSGRRCVVVGGGTVAARKIRKLLQAGAEVVVVSPEVRPDLESMDLEIRRRAYEYGDLESADLAFTATDSREVNAAVAGEAKRRGVL
ncbi:MAG: NAD(P)-dependent oxidoreductase, partial [Rubrobacteraceae bacterium]|nr:NAD(P)-dependent oxidoreductase [Rubrobacteraceae bacterium]